MAAEPEFARHGFANSDLEAVARDVGLSRPRIIQLFGSKQNLFLEVVDHVYDKVQAAFASAEPDLISLGRRYVGVLRAEPTVGLVMLQGFAAAGDQTIQSEVRRHHLNLRNSISRLTGATADEVRTFLATGLIVTVSAALDLRGQGADIAWSTRILQSTQLSHPTSLGART